MIKRNEHLWQHVKDQPGQSVAEKVYRYLNPDESETCTRGKRKNFLSMSRGYGFCGMTGKCACAAESVSKSVSKAKQGYSEEKRQMINQKRINTLEQSHGVSNAGQTPNARQSHRAVYSDVDRVESINKKIQQTKALRYQDANYNNRDKAKHTCQDKYGTDNPMQVLEIAERARKTRRIHWNPLDIFPINFDRIARRLLEQHQLEVLTPGGDYRGLYERPRWKFRCCSCSTQFHRRIGYNDYPSCPSCNPPSHRGQSGQELKILNLIQGHYLGEVISGDRMLIAPYEVDIVIPDLKLAVEYCGLYWHCEKSSGRGRSYHYEKMVRLSNLGYRLITIYSDEFEQKEEIVRRMILNRIGAGDEPILHARQCEVKQIGSSVANLFHAANHIQGQFKGSSAHWALIHNDDPVMVMSFRKTGVDQWELSRMSSCARVRGGATKLFTHFVKHHAPSRVVTFADLRWSRGEVYEIMGFQLHGQVPPMQSYVIGYDKRVPKRHFAKARLVRGGHDPTRSEWQILQEVGVDRVWDCGKKRYEWVKNS